MNPRGQSSGGLGQECGWGGSGRDEAEEVSRGQILEASGGHVEGFRLYSMDSGSHGTLCSVTDENWRPAMAAWRRTGCTEGVAPGAEEPMGKLQKGLGE